MFKYGRIICKQFYSLTRITLINDDRFPKHRIRALIHTGNIVNHLMNDRHMTHSIPQ